MRLATWNINGIRARLEFVELWLGERKPDIVGVQELKCEEDDFPFDELARLGYRALVHGQKSWNGVAVFSRQPMQTTAIGLPGFEDQGARLIAATTTDGLNFVTVYCPNGKSVDHPDFERKLAWYDGLREFIAANYSPDDDLVVCGDFNVVRAEVDSWGGDLLDGGIFHTPAERDRIQGILDWGLVDAWRARHPDDPGFTWWDYRQSSFKRKRGLRIDFMLLSSPVAERVTFMKPDRTWRAKRDELIPSDHAPVYLDLA